MTKRLYVFSIQPMLLLLMLMLGSVLSASEPSEVAINVALEAAQAHTPGKVVAHEKADERFASPQTGGAAHTLQPVYRIKILSQQGVMKTLLVHRQSGQVIE